MLRVVLKLSYKSGMPDSVTQLIIRRCNSSSLILEQDEVICNT